MEIQHRLVDDCVVIDIADDYFCHPKTVLLKNQVMHLLKDGHKFMVLNVSDIKMLDSFGLATMVSILKSCKENEGNLTLYGANDQVNRLLEITRMDRVLDVWESEGQAIGMVKENLN